MAQELPRVFDDGSHRGDHGERRQDEDGARRRPHAHGGADLVDIGDRVLVLLFVLAGQAEPQGDQRHGGEQHAGDGQVRTQGKPQRDRPGRHGAAQHRTDRPHGVERVDDGATVAALHPQSMCVLGDVGIRVSCAAEQQRGGEQQHRRRETGGEQTDAGQDGAGHGHLRRPEAPDDCCGRKTGDDRPDGEGGDRQPIGRVAEPQHLLDLGIARDDIGE